MDLTYRLYDYDRGRELHLDDGVAVADPVPYVAPHLRRTVAPGRVLLAEGPAFVLERWSRTGAGRLVAEAKRPIWLVRLAGGGTIDGGPLEAGGVWLIEDEAALTLEKGSDMLVCYPGAKVIAADW